MRWTVIGLLLLGIGCSQAEAEDVWEGPGVHYSLEEVDGSLITLSVLFKQRNASVGSGKKEALTTKRFDYIPDSDIAYLRALFTPELAEVYRADAVTNPNPGASNAKEWWVSASPGGLFVYRGAPTDQRTVQMLEKLETYTRRLLLE